MYKGITLLETLIVLFILSLTLAFALPKWQKNDPKYFLEKEQQRLHFYYPYFEGKTMLIGPKLYPSEVAVKFNGARNTMETNCFMLQAEEHRTLFSFFNVGSIKLKSDQAASACTR